MENWTRGRLLGQGSTATVSIATLHHSTLPLAVKSAELSKSDLLQKEQRVLSALISCPQIIAYKGCDVTQEYGKLFYNIFLEYAPGGTLVDAIHKHGGWVDEGLIRSYARDILLGLRHLHSNGIVHCDIKGQNILVTGDGDGDGAKIADFGCCRKVDRASKTPIAIAGTPVYMAPEVARGEEQGFPADVWAVGCTVIEMATGRAPWSNLNLSSAVSALYHIGYSGDVPEIPSFMSKQAQDFISKCFKINPRERWSVSELLKHDFVTAYPVFKDNVNTRSPTTVLDQCWDLGETWKLTHKSRSNSPIQRIRQLVQGTGEMPNWPSDDSWVTVRGKDCSTLVYANEEAATENNNNNNNISNEPTNLGGGLNTLYIRNSCSCRDNSIRYLFMACRCAKDDDVISTYNNLDKDISMVYSTQQFFHNLKIFVNVSCQSNTTRIDACLCNCKAGVGLTLHQEADLNTYQFTQPSF